MKKKYLSALLTACMLVTMTACGASEEKTVSEGNTAKNTEADGASTGSTDGIKDVADMTFEELKEAAAGTTVTFYGWGGDEKLNQWLDEEFAPLMKEKYDITMERVPMDIDQVLSQLSGEIQAGEEDGKDYTGGRKKF